MSKQIYIIFGLAQNEHEGKEESMWEKVLDENNNNVTKQTHIHLQESKHGHY